MPTKVNVTGPLLNGDAPGVIGDLLDDAEHEVAQAGVNAVRTELDRVLRRPTGRYRSAVQTDRRGDSIVVTDGGVIYGPWLEGTGSRNRTTRFRGYSTFRRVTQRLQADAVQLTEPVVETHLRRLR